MLVNKKELRVILGVSPPTLDAMILRHGNSFPVVERGANGRDWQFESDDVVAFLAARADEQERTERERETAISQLALPFGHNGGPPLDGPQGLPMKPAELLMMAKLRRLQREEEYELGRLVRVADLRAELMDAVRGLREAFRTMAFRFGADRQWPDSDTFALVKAIENCQVGFVEQLRRTHAGDLRREPELDLRPAQAAAE